MNLKVTINGKEVYEAEIDTKPEIEDFIETIAQAVWAARFAKDPHWPHRKEIAVPKADYEVKAPAQREDP